MKYNVSLMGYDSVIKDFATDQEAVDFGFICSRLAQLRIVARWSLYFFPVEAMYPDNNSILWL